MWISIQKWIRGPNKGTGSNKSLHGKTVVLTGGNSGIGAETAKDLSNRGAEVFILCRDQVKAVKTINWIRSTNPEAQVHFEPCNLASFKSIRKCVSSIKGKTSKVDFLINNAGVFCPISWRTEEDLDMQMGVNHFGHVLLTELLLPLIKRAADISGSKPRIINVSSIASQSGNIDKNTIELYTKTHQQEKWSLLPIASVQAYSDSKLANVLHAKALAKKYPAINTYSIHPGAILSTDLFRNIKVLEKLSWVVEPMLKITQCMMKRNIDGAETTLFCALDDSLNNESGEYYSDCSKQTWPGINRPSNSKLDDKIVEWFYKESLKVVGL